MANKKDLKEFYFSKGMTNTPSDSICSDDELSAEWNLIFRNGEHHVVQDPKVMFEGKDVPYMLYVHSHNNVKKYIGLQNCANGYQLVWWFDDAKISLLDPTNAFTYESYESINGITSIGNTLIVNVKGVGLRYFLWKNNEQYKYLGNRLPEADVEFKLMNVVSGYNESSHDGILNYFDDEGVLFTVDGKQREADDYIVGLYSKNKVDIARNKGFVNPFMIRYAYELFDGTYTYISIPMPMFPSVSNNSVMLFKRQRDGIGRMATEGKELYFKVNSVDLKDWSDIIKDIAIFVSEPVDIYDTDGAQKRSSNRLETYAKADSVCVGSVSDSGSRDYSMLYRSNNIELLYANLVNMYDRFYQLMNKPESQICKELSEKGVFYKLCNTGLSATSYVNVGDLIKTSDLENLTTLPMLDHDDYYNHCTLEAETVYMYNKRLHLTGVKRGFFEGAIGCMPFNYTGGSGYEYFSRVYIHAGDGDRIVDNDFTSNLHQGIYYYYPDPRAYKVEIYRKGVGLIYDYELKAHPLLNGAYYMRNTMPKETDNGLEGAMTSSVPSDRNTIIAEELPNEVWVSDVNNPFVFNASGVNTVGQGKIISVISNTVALSQGQFGQFPLICLSTDGVWALEVSSTGIYSSAHPISREICNNKNSVVATDSLVFFTSEKGLMAVDGSKVVLASPQMGGKTYVPFGEEIKVFTDNKVAYDKHWMKYLKSCKIAYDYRDSLLWIINPSEKQCYIYSIETGCVSMKTLKVNVETIVNDYPDSIIFGSYTDSNNKTYHASFSLINRKDINEDDTRYSAFMISRPLKVGDAMALKGIVMRKLIMNIDNTNGSASDKVVFRMYGSDDMEKWAQLRSFGGRGFKYYKFILLFSDLIATDTFSGVVGGFFYRYEGRLR